MTKILLLFLMGLSIFSCTKEGGTIYVDDDATNDTVPVVYFLSKQEALGDLGYIDGIYRGTVRAATQGKMKLSLAELPKDSSEAESQFRFLLERLTKESQKRKTLLVIANNDMESMLHRCEADIRKANSVDILLAETNDTTLPLHSLRIQQYGAYYLAGKVASVGLGTIDSVLIVNANPHNSNIKEMREGFTQAITDTGKEDPKKNIGIDNIYLSKDNEGFNMPDSAYRLSSKLLGKYNVVLPLCGETAQGFLRYSRIYLGDSFEIIGVDIDMQSYSAWVPFSVMKHIDNAVAQWVLQWREGIQTAHHQSFGLSSEYTEIVCSDLEPNLPNVVKEYYQLSIEKEKAYENQ